ncbi:DUF1365 family protein [Bradyrhizobium sp. CCBAU 051011]|uniref:DUF1365 family protein n=1 Tax=Bradyrhizobium sp. CCBAU 051011 TaxID=858422 RepID=UPI00352B9563
MLNTKELLRALFALPLVTFKVMAAIHWEALRLWLKGARLVPRQHAAFQNQLGERERQRLYFASVVRPCQRLSRTDRPCEVGANRRSMDRTCPS